MTSPYVEAAARSERTEAEVRVKRLRNLDGLKFRNNSANLPHPADLSRWHREGFYRIDHDNDCFRLTARGRCAAGLEAGQ